MLAQCNLESRVYRYIYRAIHYLNLDDCRPLWRFYFYGIYEIAQYGLFCSRDYLNVRALVTDTSRYAISIRKSAHKGSKANALNYSINPN